MAPEPLSPAPPPEKLHAQSPQSTPPNTPPSSPFRLPFHTPPRAPHGLDAFPSPPPGAPFTPPVVFDAAAQPAPPAGAQPVEIDMEADEEQAAVRMLNFTPLTPALFIESPLMGAASLPIASGPDTAPIPRVRLKFYTPPALSIGSPNTPHTATPLSATQVVELQNRIAQLEKLNTKQLSDLNVARSSLDAARKTHTQYKRNVAAAATAADMSRDMTGTRSSPEAEAIQRCGELEVKVQRLEADNEAYRTVRHDNRMAWHKVQGLKVQLREVSAVSDTAHVKLKVLGAELAALGKLYGQLQKRFRQNQQEGRKSAQGEADADKVNKALGRSVQTVSEQYAAAAVALASASEKAESLQGELENVSAERDELAEEVARVREGKMGRPSGFAGRAAIEAKWQSYASNAARNKAILRHQSEIRQVLQDANCSDWLPAALAGALKLEGLLEDLWATRLVAKLRWEFAKELSEVLHAEVSISLLSRLATAKRYGKRHALFCVASARTALRK